MSTNKMLLLLLLLLLLYISLFMIILYHKKLVRTGLRLVSRTNLRGYHIRDPVSESASECLFLPL